jgi:hypothetical protein
MTEQAFLQVATLSAAISRQHHLSGTSESGNIDLGINTYNALV